MDQQERRHLVANQYIAALSSPNEETLTAIAPALADDVRAAGMFGSGQGRDAVLASTGAPPYPLLASAQWDAPEIDGDVTSVRARQQDAVRRRLRRRCWRAARVTAGHGPVVEPGPGGDVGAGSCRWAAAGDPSTRIAYEITGRARVIDDPNDRALVYERSPAVERNIDPRVRGVAIVVGATAVGFIDRRRPVPTARALQRWPYLGTAQPRSRLLASRLVSLGPER